MLVFVPISRYRVEYQVASGRPYSVFERLVLEAISENVNSLDELGNLFHVHRRVLIEAVVTLMQAGWIGLKPDNTLMMTQAGTAALSSTETLPRDTAVTPRVEYVVVERSYGQVASSSEVAFISKKAFRDHGEDPARLRKSAMVPNSVEPGMVAALLRPRPQEWVRWIGPITIVRDNADYIAVDADPTSGSVIGLPHSWIPLLRDEVLERAAAAAQANQEVKSPALRKLISASLNAEERRKSEEAWRVNLSRDDVAIGHPAHERVLKDALERARSYVLIAGATLDGSIERWIDDIKSAIERGVLIDILWNEADGHALDLLKRAKAEARSPRGGLSFGGGRTRSRAQMLLCDGEGRFEAWVGTGAWLSVRGRGGSTSIRINHRKALFALCHLGADMVGWDEQLATGAGAIRLRNASAGLGAEFARSVTPAEEDEFVQASVEAGKFTLNLVVGGEHPAIAREIVRSAKKSLFVWSAAIGDGSCYDETVEALARGTTVTVRTEMALQALQVEELRKHGAHVGNSSTPGNLLLVDEELLALSSFPWLSSEGPRTRSASKDFNVGVILRGPILDIFPSESIAP